MNGNEFLKRIEKAAKLKGLEFRFDDCHGKGSHGRVWLGSKFTTLKDRRKEIGPGLLLSMCKDLGLTKQDLY